MHTIIKDSPIPESIKTKWPFYEMEIGDSIVIGNRDEWKKSCSAAAACGRKKGIKFKLYWPRERQYGQIWRIS